MKRILCLLFGHDVLVNSKSKYNIKCGRCGKRADVSRVPDNHELVRFNFNDWGFILNEKGRYIPICIAINYGCFIFYLGLRGKSFSIFKYDNKKPIRSMIEYYDWDKEFKKYEENNKKHFV